MITSVGTTNNQLELAVLIDFGLDINKAAI